jgi:hypothetical protein
MGASSLNSDPNLAHEGNHVDDRPTTVDDDHVVIGPIVDLACRTMGPSQGTTVQWRACPYGSQQTCETSIAVWAFVDSGYQTVLVSRQHGVRSRSKAHHLTANGIRNRREHET